MATLNVKNLPDALYRKLQSRARRERRSVAQQVTQILSEALETAPRRSIMELQGLGKEIWEGIDAAEHIRREREEPVQARLDPVRFSVEEGQPFELSAITSTHEAKAIVCSKPPAIEITLTLHPRSQ